MGRALTRVLLASVFTCSLAGRAGAQSFHAVQFGADVSGLGLCSTPIKTGVYGVGARLDVPLTSRVDIDGRLTWFASRALPEQGQGGHTLQGGVGVRGRFLTKGRASFSRGSGDFDRYMATAVDVGGVLERYFGRRWFMRFDGGDVISVFHPLDVNLGGTLLHVTAPRPTSSIQLAIEAGWRF